MANYISSYQESYKNGVLQSVWYSETTQAFEKQKVDYHSGESSNQNQNLWTRQNTGF